MVKCRRKTTLRLPPISRVHWLKLSCGLTRQFVCSLWYYGRKGGCRLGETPTEVDRQWSFQKAFCVTQSQRSSHTDTDTQPHCRYTAQECGQMSDSPTFNVGRSLPRSRFPPPVLPTEESFTTYLKKQKLISSLLKTTIVLL